MSPAIYHCVFSVAFLVMETYYSVPLSCEPNTIFCHFSHWEAKPVFPPLGSNLAVTGSAQQNVISAVVPLLNWAKKQISGTE
jgi:hypothetical protein